MGLLQNSTRGLGHVSVSGLSLVPKPPTRIIALRCADVAFVMVLFGCRGVERATGRATARRTKLCSREEANECIRQRKALIGIATQRSFKASARMTVSVVVTGMGEKRRLSLLPLWQFVMPLHTPWGNSWTRLGCCISLQVSMRKCRSN